MFERDTCRLLVEDPELGVSVPGDERALAQRLSEVRVTKLAAGLWRTAPQQAEAGHLGLLVLRGVVARRVMGGARASCELLGEGDLLRPWAVGHGLAAVDESVTWTVIADCELAVLDARFAERMRRWPQVTAALLDRALMRANALSSQLAILSAHPVERRLVLLLWHLAQRWGRVCPGGVRLPLPLTHGQLAEMAGVRRPSLSTAVGHLVDEGRIARPEGGRGWLLLGPPPAEDADIFELTGEALL